MIPHTLPTPPPTTGAAQTLLDGDRVVGWTGPDTIAFLGFANEVEAAHAALVADRVLARRRAQRDGRRPVPVDIEPLTLRREREGTFVHAANRRVARIVRPGDAGYDGNSHAFALTLRAPMDDVTVGAKAYLAYRTLRRSGVRWTMWLPPAPQKHVADTPPAARKAPALPAASARHEEMVVEAPIPTRYLVATLASILMLVIAAVAPGAVAVVFAALGLASLTILRLTVLHARWPRRGGAPTRAPLPI